jgi:hypothetical protein
MYELPDNDPLLQGFSKSAIDVINKIDRDLANLTKRLDEMDAKMADLNGGMFSDLERLAKNTAQVVSYWQRHNERLSR